MCDPATAMTAMRVFMVVKGVASYMQQKQQADAQENALRAGWEDIQNQYDELREEIGITESEELMELSIESLERKGEMMAASSDRGAYGTVVWQLLQDNDMKTGIAGGNIQTKTDRDLAQVDRDERGVYADTQTKMNAIDQPSLAMTVLEIGGDVAGTYAGQPASKDLSTVKQSSTTQRLRLGSQYGIPGGSSAGANATMKSPSGAKRRTNVKSYLGR